MLYLDDFDSVGTLSVAKGKKIGKKSLNKTLNKKFWKKVLILPSQIWCYFVFGGYGGRGQVWGQKIKVIPNGLKHVFF